MKKILTAINNPNLNDKLKEQKNIEVICKDIQYKDAIIDILNNNKNIDFIFINENIPGEISDDKLIKLIKEKNNKIKIIYILEKQNKKIELILRQNKIYDIYYNDEININKIIKIINNNNFKEKNLENNNKLINLNNNYKNKIITVSGPPNVGKTTFIINLFKIINNKKILIVDFDLNKQNIFYVLKINIKNKNNELIKINKNKYLISGKYFLSTFFNNNYENDFDLILFDIGSENNLEINKNIIKNSYLNIILIEGNLLGIKKFKNFIKNNNYINNPNLIINKKDNYCIDRNIIKNILGLNILGEIKYKKIYSNLINRNYNCFYNLKNNLKKEYRKIINKIIK